MGIVLLSSRSLLEVSFGDDASGEVLVLVQGIEAVRSRLEYTMT